jgi:hypothetical protein
LLIFFIFSHSELNLTGAQHLDNRPSLEEVKTTFRNARLIANIGSVILAVILVLIWPACMTAIKTMSLENLSAWVSAVIINNSNNNNKRLLYARDFPRKGLEALKTI